MMDGMLTQQAMIMSYNDSFVMILLFNFITLPAILLLGKAPVKFGGQQPSHAAVD